MTCSGHLCPSPPKLGLRFSLGKWASLGEVSMDAPPPPSHLNGLIWRLKAETRCFLLSPTSARTDNSFYRKTARLLNGSEQFVVKFVVVLVGRNVDPIKTAHKQTNKQENI